MSAVDATQKGNVVSTSPRSPIAPSPRKRIGRACDACRARKVRCLHDGTICRACRDLGVLCTQNKPQRRRGPVNRYVASQMSDAESTVLDGATVGVDTPTPPVMPELLSPVTYQPSPPSSSTILDQIGPPYLLRQIIDDWFEYVHSVAPILHRRQFLSCLEQGHAAQDADFCALVISLCAATVATLRHRSYGTITVLRCWNVIHEYDLLRQTNGLSLEICLARYNMATALASTRRVENPEVFLLFAQCVAGVKHMLYYNLTSLSAITQQLLKRLYWLLFVWDCTVSMLGRPTIGVLTAHDNIATLRPLPLTDSELDPLQALEEPIFHGDHCSYIPGLNHLVDLLLLWHESQQPHNRAPDQLELYLSSVQHALNELPPELRWRGGLSRPPGSNFGTDVQVANIYITQLQIRSNLLEQIRGSPGFRPTNHEHQNLVNDLLEILDRLPRDVLLANGYSLVPKVRDIGAAFLDEVRIGPNKDLIDNRARMDLQRLLSGLGSLDL